MPCIGWHAKAIRQLQQTRLILACHIHALTKLVNEAKLSCYVSVQP